MGLRGVDLNLFVTLEALLRERNVTRAGHMLDASQPTMSAALSRLRDIFDDELLMRIGREYRLTPLAHDLLGPLQAALTSLSAMLERRASFDPRSSAIEFNIAASDYAFSVLIPKLLAHFAEVAPSIRLRLRLVDSFSASKLASGELDLAIQPSVLASSFPSEVLFEDKWVCAVWSGNKEVSDPMTLQEWSALPHACVSLGRSSIVLNDLLFGSLADTRERQVVSESFLALPLIVPRTRLVAVLPSRLGEHFTRNPEIRLVRPPKPIVGFSESMSWNACSDSDPAHGWLRQQLKLVAAQHLCTSMA